MSADGQRAVFDSGDTLQVWDLEGTDPPRILDRDSGGVRAVALSADGKRALSGSSDETTRVWDLEGNQPPRILKGHTGAVNAVALSDDGKRAVSGHGAFRGDAGNNVLEAWDLEGSRSRCILEGHMELVHAVALSNDGQHAVSGSEDHILRVWDLESGGCLKVFTCDAAVLSCAWAGDRIVAGDDSGRVHLFAWEE
jgi:WD40 repeat protein